jgi:hypothetical protein
MFTTNLTLQDRRALMFILVSAPLLERYRTQRELLEDEHAKVLKKWLDNNGRKASLITRARFLSISSRFYKQLVRTQQLEDLDFLCGELTDTFAGKPPAPIAQKLMDDCSQLLVEHQLDK